MKFYLGTPEPSWLGWIGVPLFVSRARLARYKSWSPAICEWALDSNGYKQLEMHGRWTFTAKEYWKEVSDYKIRIGMMDFAAIQDWMCEPQVLAKTRKTIAEHQRRTVENYLELQDLGPQIPWLPVIQGYRIEQYLECVELYDRMGVDLKLSTRVGVGTLCRRQGTREVFEIVKAVCGLGIKIHGFGLKKDGIQYCFDLMESADSMAWSLNALHYPPMLGCTHERCTSCPRYALDWRRRILEPE